LGTPRNRTCWISCGACEEGIRLIARYRWIITGGLLASILSYCVWLVISDAPDKGGAGKHVSRWKKRMDHSIRRAVKASRGAIHTMHNSGSSHKAERLALRAKREVIKAAKGL